MLVNASEEAQRNVLANSNAQELLNLGVMLRTQGLFDEALEIFERLIERNPHDYLARTYAGMMYLQQGRWEAGWKLYRARWLSPGWERLAYQVEHLWDGELREGLQLLVWAEQGYGDAIQFSRYFHWLMDQGVDVVFQGPVALHSLFERSFPSLKLLSDGATVAVDAHVPMLDLPLYIPKFSPDRYNGPYLASKAIASTRPRPDGHLEPLRVGLAWRGRPSHPDDARRSIPEADLGALARVLGVQWILLQQGFAAPEALPDATSTTFDDFLGTVECIETLDLVITVDTVVAHLAGAMGKPVWMLLPFVPDWRWGCMGSSTAWYPSMTLFRQGDSMAWSPVLEKVAIELHQRVRTTSW